MCNYIADIASVGVAERCGFRFIAEIASMTDRRPDARPSYMRPTVSVFAKRQTPGQRSSTGQFQAILEPWRFIAVAAALSAVPRASAVIVSCN
jgi:hypothetical protein